MNFVEAKTIKTFPSLDLALGLVLATSWPRLHATPTWFQSTAAKKIARVSRLFKINMSSAKWTNGSEFLLDMAVVSYKKEEFLVLDGGVATELTRAGFNLDVCQSHSIYSTSLLAWSREMQMTITCLLLVFCCSK